MILSTPKVGMPCTLLTGSKWLIMKEPYVITNVKDDRHITIRAEQKGSLAELEAFYIGSRGSWYLRHKKRRISGTLILGKL